VQRTLKIKYLHKISDERKQNFDYNQIAMTFHESGHAICAINNLVYVFSINVMTPKNEEGLTSYYTFNEDYISDNDLKETIFTAELQTLYAGLIAEKIYYKDICGSDKFPMHLRIGSSEDMKMASKIIRTNKLVKSGKQTSLLKKQIQKDVNLFLIENWDAVKAVAHALYKKHRLSFDELKFILTRKTNHNDFWKEKFKKIKIIYDDKNPPVEQDVKIILDQENI